MLTKKWRLFFLLGPTILILDQLTKRAVEASIPLWQRTPVIPGFFDLVHFRNKGAAFGMLADVDSAYLPFFFFAVAGAASIFLFFYFRSLRDDDLLIATALSLIFGGMLGNIVDRIRQGFVTDFLSFHLQDKMVDVQLLGRHFHFSWEWPAFNVADSAITIAMLLLVISMIRRKN